MDDTCSVISLDLEHEGPSLSYTNSNKNTEEEKKSYERLKVISPQTQRKLVMAEIFFLDYYFDLITYIHKRKRRFQKFQHHVQEAQLTKEQEEAEWNHLRGQESAFLRKRRSKLRFSDFEVLLQIGEGGYGQVFLCRKQDTKELCAVKRMEKKRILERKKVENTFVERDVLTTTRSPWLVKLLYSFQDYHNVYLAMEYVAGGDLRALLNEIECVNEEPTKFYIAEMILAVVQLHSLGFIHRDIKPENFLIDEKGHIKLTDFGLAKGKLNDDWIEDLRKKLELIDGPTYVTQSSSEKRKMHRERAMGRSIVGTPDYMAPELLKGVEYDLKVDFWAIGCILFEMLYGYAPFTASTIQEIFFQIQNHKIYLQRPDEESESAPVTNEAWDLITKLLAPYETRFGSLIEIKEHPFFADVDWDNIRECQTPFVPELASPDDTKYFDIDEFTQGNFDFNSGEGGSIPRKPFIGFTYKHQNWQNTVMKKDIAKEVKHMIKKNNNL